VALRLQVCTSIYLYNPTIVRVGYYYCKLLAVNIYIYIYIFIYPCAIYCEGSAAFNGEGMPRIFVAELRRVVIFFKLAPQGKVMGETRFLLHNMFHHLMHVSFYTVGLMRTLPHVRVSNISQPVTGSGYGITYISACIYKIATKFQRQYLLFSM